MSHEHLGIKVFLVNTLMPDDDKHFWFIHDTSYPKKFESQEFNRNERVFWTIWTHQSSVEVHHNI